MFEDLTWRLTPGRTVLLGPNGAGKTTLLALAATALTPERGTIEVDGLAANRRRDRAKIRRCVGWMPQHAYAIPGLTSREQVAYSGWLKGLSRSDAWTGAAVALDRVGLTAERDRLASELSGGQRHRVGLAQLLVQDAEVLLLDEPTAGLDPAQRSSFRTLIHEVGEGRSLLASTHQVDDLDDLFDTAVVMDHGRMLFHGPVTAFLGLAPRGAAYRGESAYATLVRHSP
ncbi:MAG: ATP-binding cassette domain-containing protein [Chloroflexota bacterium]